MKKTAKSTLILIFTLLVALFTLSLSSFAEEPIIGEQSDSETVFDATQYKTDIIPLTPDEKASLPFLPEEPETFTLLPETVNLQAFFPPVGNQGSQGSCSGWTIAYAAKSAVEQRNQNWGVNTAAHQFSPSYIYNQVNDGVDRGAKMSRALDVVENQGVCTLQDWPYLEYDFRTQPNNTQIQSASKYKDKWFSIGEANIVENMKRQLSKSNPVMVAFPVYNDFDIINGNNPIYDNIYETSRGGHAVTLTGYDDSKKAFSFINSWGNGYGLNGYGYISYDLINYLVLNYNISDPAHLIYFEAYVFNAQYVDVTLVSENEAGGTVSGGGIIQQGTTASVTAQPNLGYTFNGWYENGNLVSTDSVYTFQVTNDRTLVARFFLENADTWVTNFYIELLNRNPSSSEVAAWVTELNIGKLTISEIADHFINSPEYKNRNLNNTDFVLSLYKALLWRGADPQSELSDKLNALDMMVPRRSILKTIVDSLEFTNLCNQSSLPKGTIVLERNSEYDFGLTKAVYLMYKEGLGRAPNKEEMDYRCDLVLNKNYTVHDMYIGVLLSQEASNRNLSNYEYVSMLYQVVLQRGGSNEEINGWANYIDMGHTRGDVLNGIMYSEEFFTYILPTMNLK